MHCEIWQIGIDIKYIKSHLISKVPDEMESSVVSQSPLKLSQSPRRILTVPRYELQPPGQTLLTKDPHGGTGTEILYNRVDHSGRRVNAPAFFSQHALPLSNAPFSPPKIYYHTH